MKSLVTGGAGLIGAHVVRALLSAGHEVVVLDDLSGGRKEQVDARATFAQGSILSDTLIDQLFEQYSFDYVFHFAAYAAEGLSHFIRRYNYNDNLIGSVNLINAAVRHDVKCFVFASSIAVYGEQAPPVTEETTPHPVDPYGIAKYAVELDLQAAKQMFGLDHIIFRPHNVYGELQNIGDPYRNVVGIFMNQLMQGKELTIFGDGCQTRAFSYVGDIAPVIAASVQHPDAYNQVFNIGADEHCSVNELAKAVMEAMHIEGTLKYLEPRNEVEHIFADHSKLRSYFDVKHTPLEEGLKRMATWAKEAGARSSRTFSHLEIEQNLPPIWRS